MSWFGILGSEPAGNRFAGLSSALDISVVPILRSITKSTSRFGGSPGSSSGKTSSNSQTTGTEDTVKLDLLTFVTLAKIAQAPNTTIF